MKNLFLDFTTIVLVFIDVKLFQKFKITKYKVVEKLILEPKYVIFKILGCTFRFF